MYLALSDEQKMLAQTVRRFVEKELPSSKVRQIMATESETSGKYTLSGTKMFALDAGVSDIIIVTAKEEGKLGLFLVEKGAAGLVVEILEGMDLSRRLTRVKLNNTPAEKIDACTDP